jgi:hypothetical protein
MIGGFDGTGSGYTIFTIIVSNTNRAPSIATISAESVAENSAITAVNANDGGDDFDIDGQAISYTCYYDTSDNNAVADVTTCASLTGVSFTTNTGAMTWTPNYTQSGTYEFKITGSDGDLSSSAFFTITVTNTNAPPSIDAISNQTVDEGEAIAQINAGDGGDDTDVDGTTITYACFYDTTVNGIVAETTSCTTLTNFNFTTNTGVITWTPTSSQSGNYEIKIRGSDGSLTGSTIFTITVVEPSTAPAPTLRHTIIPVAVSSGNLGGISAANALCNSELASFSSAGGVWKAVLSDTTQNAKDRISYHAPIYNNASTPVLYAQKSDNIWSGSFPGTTVPNVFYDKNQSLLSSFTIFTGSQWDGLAVTDGHCTNWTSGSDSSNGLAVTAGGLPEIWLGSNFVSCDSPGYIHCINGQVDHIIFLNGVDSSYGNLGGLSGADTKCQTAATAAGLTGKFKALLSDSTEAARDRIRIVGPVFNNAPTRQIMFKAGATVFGGTAQAAYNYLADGTEAQGFVWAYTGSTTSGETATDNHCDNWSSSHHADDGRTGDTFGGANWLNSSNLSDCRESAGSYMCIGGQLDHVIFAAPVTDGDLGGLSVADVICQNTATAASLTGTYKAILSTSSVHAKNRVAIDGPVYNTAGQMVFSARDSVWNSSIRAEIKAANGANGNRFVFTGTNTSGEFAGDSCGDWLDDGNSDFANGGDQDVTSTWLSGSQHTCGSSGKAIYCISQ